MIVSQFIPIVFINPNFTLVLSDLALFFLFLEVHTAKPTVVKKTTAQPTVTTATKSTTNPVNGYCIKHATSGKYLSKASDGSLSYTTACGTRFSDLNTLRIAGSSECAALQGQRDGDYIKFDTSCLDKYVLQQKGNLFSIQHAITKKCIHPKGGSINPKDGTKAVIYSGCDYSRLRFVLEGK